MGYFSCGAEGNDYEARYCSRCIHGQDQEEGCPVMSAHVIHNYKECNNPSSILHMLIPRDDVGNNKQCRMFVAEGGG